MIRTLKQFYSYIFQEEQGITAAYFQTNSGTEYRVYFYPVPEYFDILSSNTKLYACGYFFGFTKIAPNEEKKEPLDFRVRNTILIIINNFFAEKGIDKVLIFFCDNDDGKKSKRFICFDLWYKMAESNAHFNKYNEEIIVVDEYGVKADINYMSLIIENTNPNTETLLQEFQTLKEQLVSNK
jgi:hypothetical protein